MSDGLKQIMDSPGGAQKIDDIIWRTAGSNPGDVVFFFGVGIVLEALVMTAVWSQVIRYYRYFGRSDPIPGRIAIGFACAVTTGKFVSDMRQLESLIRHAYTDYFSYIDMDYRMAMARLLMGGALSSQASMFYSWRIYKLAGSKLLVLAFYGTITIASWVFSTFTSIRALVVPKVTLENATQFLDELKGQAIYIRAAGLLQCSHDVFLCASMIFLLYRVKTSLFHLEVGIFRKLVIMIFGSMLPAVSLMLALQIDGLVEGGMININAWPRIIWPPIGALYYHSLLHALVSRKALRDHLNSNLSDQGVQQFPISVDGSGATTLAGTIHVSTEKHLSTTPTEDIKAVQPVRHSLPGPPDHLPTLLEEDQQSRRTQRSTWTFGESREAVAEIRDDDQSERADRMSTTSVSVQRNTGYTVDESDRVSYPSGIPPSLTLEHDLAEYTLGVHPFARAYGSAV